MTFEQKQKILKKELLTTKDAADLIGVSLPSIINWADAGRFESCRTPGGHRRIRRQHFVEFAQQNGYLTDLAFQEVSHVSTNKIVLLDSNPDYVDTLKDFLLVNEGTEVFISSNIFESGLLLGLHQPTLFVFDQDSVRTADSLYSLIRKNISTASVHVVVLASEYPVPVTKQVNNYIYLNKGSSIRDIATSLMNLAHASVVV